MAGLAMALTPESCNLLGRCPWTSGFGIALLSAPVIALAAIVALGMSLMAWRRRR
nr:hypothetical protein [uncultured Roseococcus sp.]